MKKTALFLGLVAALVCGNANADLISEFEPNPAGADGDTIFELSGTAGAMFAYSIISLENDGFAGTADRVYHGITGTYDANGLALVTVADLENPSFTILLTDPNAIVQGDDLDLLDDGSLDTSGLGTIYDSVGVSDSVGDDATLYSDILGGSSILYNGEFEPLGVFRDLSTGAWYQYVTVDFGGANEHIGIFAANGGPELDPASFTGGDPLATTYGAINPTFNAIPEPGSIAVLGLVGLAAIVRRRK